MHIRVTIVDDHPMIIDGLKAMLQGYGHISLLGWFSNGTALLEGLEKEQPDVLLMDIQLPGIPGDELAPLILKQYPHIRIMALTNFDSSLYVTTMMRHGVSGYLLKTATQNVLIQAIETVYNGELFIEPLLREKINAGQGKVNKHIYTRLAFTIREKQIIKLLAAGKSNQEIADTLFIGYNTVRNYRARIFDKMDVSSISELVNKVFQLGLND